MKPKGSATVDDLFNVIYGTLDQVGGLQRWQSATTMTLKNFSHIRDGYDLGVEIVIAILILAVATIGWYVFHAKKNIEELKCNYQDRVMNLVDKDDMQNYNSNISESREQTVKEAAAKATRIAGNIKIEVIGETDTKLGTKLDKQDGATKTELQNLERRIDSDLQNVPTQQSIDECNKRQDKSDERQNRIEKDMKAMQEWRQSMENQKKVDEAAQKSEKEAEEKDKKALDQRVVAVETGQKTLADKQDAQEGRIDNLTAAVDGNTTRTNELEATVNRDHGAVLEELQTKANKDVVEKGFEALQENIDDNKRNQDTSDQQIRGLVRLNEVTLHRCIHTMAGGRRSGSAPPTATSDLDTEAQLARMGFDIARVENRYAVDMAIVRSRLDSMPSEGFAAQVTQQLGDLQNGKIKPASMAELLNVKSTVRALGVQINEVSSRVPTSTVHAPSSQHTVAGISAPNNSQFSSAVVRHTSNAVHAHAGSAIALASNTFTPISPQNGMHLSVDTLFERAGPGNVVSSTSQEPRPLASGLVTPQQHGPAGTGTSSTSPSTWSPQVGDGVFSSTHSPSFSGYRSSESPLEDVSDEPDGRVAGLSTHRRGRHPIVSVPGSNKVVPGPNQAQEREGELIKELEAQTSNLTIGESHTTNGGAMVRPASVQPQQAINLAGLARSQSAGQVDAFAKTAVHGATAQTEQAPQQSEQQTTAAAITTSSQSGGQVEASASTTVQGATAQIEQAPQQSEQQTTASAVPTPSQPGGHAIPPASTAVQGAPAQTEQASRQAGQQTTLLATATPFKPMKASGGLSDSKHWHASAPAAPSYGRSPLLFGRPRSRRDRDLNIGAGHPVKGSPTVSGLAGTSGTTQCPH